MSYSDDVIGCLVEAQIAPWRDRDLSGADLENRLIRLSETHFGTFVFTVEKDNVFVRANPGIAAIIESGGDHEVHRRAVLFRSLIQDAVKSVSIQDRLVFAIDVLDLAESSDLPVFSFQKRICESNILLPDFELISLGFLEAHTDSIPFLEKQNRAYFTGSTTGALNYSMDDVNAGRVARIRSARAFRDSDEVIFRLNNIVQYADESVRDALIAEGFGGGEAPLLEAFGYKFGISIDGNGAPCSRPAVILKSKSCLLRYNSPYILYYSSAIRDGEHYVAVDRDEDVIRIVREERESAGLYCSIAAAGESFSARYLSKAAATEYTYRLLLEYNNLFKKLRL